MLHQVKIIDKRRLIEKTKTNFIQVNLAKKLLYLIPKIFIQKTPNALEQRGIRDTSHVPVKSG